MGRVHPEHPLSPVVGVATAPGQTGREQPLRDANLLKDLQGAAGEDDGPAAFGDLALGLENDRGHAMAGQLQGRHQTGRAGPDNHHLLAPLLAMPGWQPGLVDLVAVVDRGSDFGAGLVHGGHPCWGRVRGARRMVQRLARRGARRTPALSINHGGSGARPGAAAAWGDTRAFGAINWIFPTWRSLDRWPDSSLQPGVRGVRGVSDVSDASNVSNVSDAPGAPSAGRHLPPPFR